MRMLGMTCVPLLVISFLPLSGWGYVGIVILGLWILMTLRGAFHPTWDEYETIGAFVTLGTLTFAGVIWTPESWWWLRLVFGFLFVTGIATKFKQIDHINKGLGPDLSKDGDRKSAS